MSKLVNVLRDNSYELFYIYVIYYILFIIYLYSEYMA